MKGVNVMNYQINNLEVKETLDSEESQDIVGGQVRVYYGNNRGGVYWGNGGVQWGRPNYGYGYRGYNNYYGYPRYNYGNRGYYNQGRHHHHHHNRSFRRFDWDD